MKTGANNESGMTLMAVMIFMTVFAFILMTAAPSIQMDVQREKELEAIRRGEEIQNAIHQFALYHENRNPGTGKLPSSLDELLEGLPDGTKKRQILRPSATIDPLTLDGRWRLIQPEPDTIARFAKRVQIYHNGILPSSPASRIYDRYTVTLANILNTEDTADAEEDEEDMNVEENVPFIGVASQSRMRSVVTYYGIENHSKWIFTPLFRGTGGAMGIRPGGIRPPGR